MIFLNKIHLDSNLILFYLDSSLICEIFNIIIAYNICRTETKEHFETRTKKIARLANNISNKTNFIYFLYHSHCFSCDFIFLGGRAG